MKRYHVTTFGCQMNEHDSERMKGMLESLGYDEAPEQDEADLILFNTCSIREKATSASSPTCARRRPASGGGPGRRSASGGCWAQSVKDEVFRQFPFVDVAFGPGQVHKLAEFLTADSLTAQGYFEFEGFAGDLPMKRGRDAQAWVQISVGCNMRCSYCIVPSTRGREVSRPFADIVAECERLAADGVREVTLLGQNVNAYGRDLRPDARSFADLLHAVDGVEGIDRVRYTSPHPQDMKEDVVLAHAELASVCEHIHLPLQAGSSRILKAMRRTYNRERFLDRVALIREHVPDCALTTDVIVGFPGETEEDFAQTLEVMEEVGFDGAFTFVFSPRRGTEAAEITGGPRAARGQGRADAAPGRGRPAARARARPALRRPHARGARGGPVADGSHPAARPLPARQGRELLGMGAARRARPGRGPQRLVADARGGGVPPRARGGALTRRGWAGRRSHPSVPRANMRSCAGTT
jgi:tRNA-2-methylthio-N6-dimethylallyladenosine synthase